MQKRKIIQVLLMLTVVGCSSHAQVSRSQFTAELDKFTQQLLSKVPVIPSISITIVDANGPVFVKAYGWADKEASIKADENTLFYIASSTKSFTGLAAALLDHEKKIMLDDPFKKYFLPLQFKNEIGDNVTIRNLLTHTSGLENSPLTFRAAYTGDIQQNEMQQVLKDVTVVKSTPGQYKYDNLGYNIYGMVLQEHLHKKWQDVLQEKIFSPLGMTRTTAYVSLANKNKWPLAVPYFAYSENGLTRLYLQKSDNTMQSAGGLMTTPADIAKWLQVQLNNGKLNNKQVFPAQVIQQTHEPFANFEKGSAPFATAGGYGLGWSSSTYHDEKVIYHFGGFPGFKAHISFMPGKNIGVAIFVNEASIGSPAVDLLASYIYDWVMAVPDHANVYAKKLDELQSAHEKGIESTQKTYADRAKRVSQLTLPLNAYTGKYSHAYFGQIEVNIENNALAVKMGNMHAVSTPFTQKETIRVELIPGTGQVVGFKADENGKVNGLVYDGIEYKRIQ
jgi:CubicO group peptidase (beta-lactamase class C family)